MKQLIFIDTNIFLDFYRMKNEGQKGFAGHIEKVKDILIMTYQVEMEFKKNRQTVIAETMKKLKAPSKIARPGILSDDRTYKALNKNIKEASERVKKLRERLQRVFEKPSQHDSIYVVFQRVSKKEDDITLQRGTKKAIEIRDLALKRFRLGYPPRKKGDNSIGDAVNWEWIVEVATREKPDKLLLVTRDADFGITINDSFYLNDWLKEEFKKRAGTKTKIKLYTQLSNALKDLNINVTKNEKKFEDLLLYRDISEYQPIEGECIRCGGEALFDAICEKCGEYVLGNEDGECYSFEDNKVFSDGTEYGGQVICSKCNNGELKIEFQSLCSWCEHMALKDD